MSASRRRQALGSRTSTGLGDDGWDAAVILRTLSESWVLLGAMSSQTFGGDASSVSESAVPYGVDSSDGMAPPAGSEERQRCQAFRNSKPPSGPSATGIPSMR